MEDISGAIPPHLSWNEVGVKTRDDHPMLQEFTLRVYKWPTPIGRAFFRSWEAKIAHRVLL